MSKENIELFYDIRNLFNIPKDTFELYFNIKSRIFYNRETEFGRNILLVFPTRQIAERTKKQMVVKTNMYKNKNNEITDGKTRYYVVSIEELKCDNFMTGRRFTNIRFLG